MKTQKSVFDGGSSSSECGGGGGVGSVVKVYRKISTGDVNPPRRVDKVALMYTTSRGTHWI